MSTHSIEDVISNDMCIGCGGCSIRTGGAVKVTLGIRGVFEASLGDASPDQIRAASRICPLSDDSLNEDELAKERFPDLATDSRVGSYRDVFAGRITSDEDLMGSSSGGLTSYVLGKMMEQELVNGVIHVGKAEGGSLFEYRISESISEVKGSRKSAYYSTTMVEAFDELKLKEGTFALVGVPCFIKAARSLAKDMPEIDSKIKFYVGIVCGHLKSKFFAESLAWQAGVKPEDLKSFDFRLKNPERPANKYDYEALGSNGEVGVRRTSSTVDGSWGMGAFQPNGCNFCDDIFAETADIVFGDAWLPQYSEDWRGTNIVISRSAPLSEILRAGTSCSEVVLDELTLDQVTQSQAGNFRHRRLGLQVRLKDRLKKGLSVPVKRVLPAYPVGFYRRLLIRKRQQISELSFSSFIRAKESGHLEDDYISPMAKAAKQYRSLDSLSKGPKHWIKEFLKRIKSFFRPLNS